MISALYFESLIYAIFDYAQDDDWQFSQGAIECSCQAQLPPIFFQFDGKWIEARPEDYIFDYYGQNDRCILWILPTNMPMHILGMPVFVDYYSIHDPVAGTVDWAPHTNSPKDTVLSGPVPTEQFLVVGEVEQQSTTDMLIEYAMAAVVCYGAIYYWQTSVYPWLILAENAYSEQQVKLFSGGYFFTVAIFYYYVIHPVFSTIANTATSDGSASASYSIQ